MRLRWNMVCDSRLRHAELGLGGCFEWQLATLSRLKRIDGLRREAEVVLRDESMAKAKTFQARLMRLYLGQGDRALGFAGCRGCISPLLDRRG